MVPTVGMNGPNTIKVLAVVFYVFSPLSGVYRSLFVQPVTSVQVSTYAQVTTVLSSC